MDSFSTFSHFFLFGYGSDPLNSEFFLYLTKRHSSEETSFPSKGMLGRQLEILRVVTRKVGKLPLYFARLKIYTHNEGSVRVTHYCGDGSAVRTTCIGHCVLQVHTCHL